MSLSPIILIHDEDPFKECKLGREKYARVLTQIINSNPSGFVLGLNSGWGTGKTTFLQMWQMTLKKEGYSTLYFNAWLNDFDDSPLISLIAEFKKLGINDNSKEFSSLLEKTALLAKNISPRIIKTALNSIIPGSGDFAEDITKGAADIFSEEINKRSKREKTIIEFRQQLEDYVISVFEKAPLIFVIDELDRCRPSFAVDVLEAVKHFFTVKGIVFVLSFDKKHLSHSIKGRYGSDLIDADDYLRRFLDLEYTLPDPSYSDSVNFFFDTYNLDDFFKHSERKGAYNFQNDAELVKSVLVFFSKKRALPLRQQEKLFVHIKIALKLFSPKSQIIPSVFISLLILKTYHKDLFDLISTARVTPQELLDRISTIYPNDIDEYERRMLLFMEANLIDLYCTSFVNPIWIQDYRATINESSDKGRKLKSHIDKSENVEFGKALNDVAGRNDGVRILEIMEKINLSAPFNW